MSGPSGRARRLAARTLAMAGKETLHVVRDPRTLYVAIGVPIVLLVIFGFGVSFDLDHVPMAVVDEDRTPASRELSVAFTSGGEFDVAARPARTEEVDRLFRTRSASLALVIPRGLQASWDRGERVPVQLLLDGADLILHAGPMPLRASTLAEGAFDGHVIVLEPQIPR